MRADGWCEVTRANIRRQIEDWIERAIDMLDELDSDADFEIETDFDINPVSLQPADRRPVKRVTARKAA